MVINLLPPTEKKELEIEKIGQQLPLKILRHGRQKTLKIILGEKK